MNVLIVYAHENNKSFNAAMKDVAVETLTATGHSVVVSDLYAQGFNPVASRHDFTKLSGAVHYKFQKEQRYAAEGGYFAADIKAEMEKFKTADLVIYQFPLWWFGLPAIMKGWFDRVFAMDFAYGDGRIFDRGPFRGKRAMCALTTGGPEQSYPDFNDTVLRPIQFGLLYFAGMDVLPPFTAFAAAHLDDDARKYLLAKYSMHLKGIETLELLKFPTMAEMGML
jgi:NAD(P)H dehydrogenase (quinone)